MDINTDSDSFEVTVLGGFAAHRGASRLGLKPSAQRLVALLAVEGERSRLDAAALLWTDLSQDRAMGNLRTVLWRLRRDSPGLIGEEGDTLRLAADHVDLRSVRAWADAVLFREDHIQPVPDHTGRDLLPGWGDEWLMEPREELHLLQLHALEAAAQRLMNMGRLGEACSRALAAVRMDPLRESAARLVIEIHIREGNRVDAIRRFRRFETHLRDEVNSEPSPALIALVAHLLAIPGTAPPPPPDMPPRRH